MTAAISIRQPWAWLIIRPDITDPIERAAAFVSGDIKVIENRDWPTNFRGRLLVHASKTRTKAEYQEAIDFLVARGLDRLLHALPAIDQFDRGGIIGSVDVVDCVTRSDSHWFIGKHGFVLRNSKPLTFTPWKGHLGFFNVQGVEP